MNRFEKPYQDLERAHLDFMNEVDAELSTTQSLLDEWRNERAVLARETLGELEALWQRRLGLKGRHASPSRLDVRAAALRQAAIDPGVEAALRRLERLVLRAPVLGLPALPTRLEIAFTWHRTQHWPLLLLPGFAALTSWLVDQTTLIPWLAERVVMGSAP